MNNKSSPNDILPGYVLCNDNAFEAFVGPFYQKRWTDAQGRAMYSLAVRVGSHHLGAPGRSHGGFVLLLLDQAMGIGAEYLLNDFGFTISIHTDFVGPAPEGEWLEIHTWATSTTASFAFMNGVAEAKGKKVAVATGVWRRRRTGVKAANDTPEWRAMRNLLPS